MKRSKAVIAQVKAYVEPHEFQVRLYFGSFNIPIISNFVKTAIEKILFKYTTIFDLNFDILKTHAND